MYFQTKMQAGMFTIFPPPERPAAVDFADEAALVRIVGDLPWTRKLWQFSGYGSISSIKSTASEPYFRLTKSLLSTLEGTCKSAKNRNRSKTEIIGAGV